MSARIQMDRYHIVDEPRPGVLSRFAIPPFVPFLAVMLLATPGFLLFVLNSFALGGQRRRTEVLYAALAFALAVAMSMISAWLLRTGVLAQAAMPYVKIGVTAVILWFGYKIYLIQAETYEMRSYLRNLGDGR